jgi:predicted GTPase
MNSREYNTLVISGASTINDNLIYKLVGNATPVNPDDEQPVYKRDCIKFYDFTNLPENTDAEQTFLKKMSEVDLNGNFVIDNILVVLDATDDSFNVPYRLLTEVILPNYIGDRELVFIINNADVPEISRKSWDYWENIPKGKGKSFINSNMRAIKKELQEKSSFTINTNSVYPAPTFDENGNKLNSFDFSEVKSLITYSAPSKRKSIYSQQRVKDESSIEKGLEVIVTGIESATDKLSDFLDKI